MRYSGLRGKAQFVYLASLEVHFRDSPRVLKGQRPDHWFVADIRAIPKRSDLWPEEPVSAQPHNARLRALLTRRLPIFAISMLFRVRVAVCTVTICRHLLVIVFNLVRCST